MDSCLLLVCAAVVVWTSLLGVAVVLLRRARITFSLELSVRTDPQREAARDQPQAFRARGPRRHPVRAVNRSPNQRDPQSAG